MFFFANTYIFLKRFLNIDFLFNNKHYSLIENTYLLLKKSVKILLYKKGGVRI